MQKLITVISILLLMAISSFGQDPSIKYGKCSLSELNMKECSFEPSAEAMVLFDVCKFYQEYIDDHYQTIIERHIRIKVFSKAGLDYAEYEIPFERGKEFTEKINQIKGISYNLVNGKITETELEDKYVHEVKKVGSHYLKKLAMPDVKEGTVFEIYYRKTGDYITFTHDWLFQSRIPTLYSEFFAKISPHFEYTHILRGEEILDDYQKYEDNAPPIHLGLVPYHSMIHKFIMRELPAFKDESFITSMNDYASSVDFQLSLLRYYDGRTRPILLTWPKLNEELLEDENLGGYIKTSERAGKDIIEELKLESLPQIEKAKKIDSYLKQEFIYNDYQTKYSSKNFRELQAEKTGNSADLNLLAIGLMRAAGLNIQPLILSTRDHGKIQRAYPFVSSFDYVMGLLDIDSSLYLIDVTEPLLKFGEIPTYCLNDAGLIVQKETVDWINFESIAISEEKYELDITPDLKTDSLSISYKMTSSYYEALENRHDYNSDYDELAEDLLGKDYKSFDSVKCTNLKEIEMPFILDYKNQEVIEKVEDKIIIDPFCGIPVSENPLKQPERHYPIDFNYKWARTFSVNIRIPENYKVISKPENIGINNKNVRIIYVVNEQTPGVLNIIGSYQFKKDVYPVEEYLNLKAYYDQIITKFNEKVVLQATEI
ncbi:MAG TPA: transglutaminase domain-containing protein [Lentimicrobium sp.]|nr:transglutaminase domain-containing protein [Lentimicrobium sp.]